MLLGLISLAALAILVAFFVLNQKIEKQVREGIVKEILNKDALFVEFDDRRSNVVKLSGLKMATEKEMLDEQIFEFLYREVRGQRVRVNPMRVDTGDILVSEIYSMADEYLNAILVRQGFARWNPLEAANDRRLSDAQETAKTHLQGVWNPAVQQLMAEYSREPISEDEKERGQTEETLNSEKDESPDLSDDPSHQEDDPESVPANLESRTESK